VANEGWMSERATSQWMPDLYVKESEDLPWYKSWNTFFTRTFKDPGESRPIAGAGDPTIIASSNDGGLFRWRDNVSAADTFWFKEMPYSLSDIFRSADPGQSEIFAQFNLADRFKGGFVFQTFLNPFNFHRWWAPVAGKLLFDPFVIQGVYYSKLDIPDFDGSTTDSLPYLLQVNCRGICVIDTGEDNIGYVCCIPIGMIEVSTVIFNDIPADIEKGTELGCFQFGGSSFAIIFEDVAKYNKKIEFRAVDNIPGLDSPMYPQNPELPTPTGGGITINVGQQIAVISPLS
jgi:phosphatidylserine decarboxylase